MMKILDVQQIRDLDTYTILHEPIASIDLMERASVAFTQYILKHFGRQYSFMIFCGLGNNGGDGLAIARLLIGYQYQVKVWVVDYTEKQSDDFRWNYERLAQVTTIQHIQTEEDWQVSTSTPADCIVIDALLGSGINRPVEGLLAKVIEGINTLPYTKVAVDIASGLYANQPINTQNTIICPDLTISFQLPKMAFLLPENQQYVGHWEVLDIGLSKTYIKDVLTPYYYTVLPQVKQRSKFSHKGTYGHALVIAGSRGSIGASVLASKACLRSGVGLLSVHIPTCGYHIMQASVPEAICSTDKHEAVVTEYPHLQKYSAIGVGCGLGKASETVTFLKNFLLENTKPLVLDADALNILAENQSLLAFLQPQTILTPHPKELQRLVGHWQNDYEKLNMVQQFAQQYQVIVVIKGMYSAVVLPSGAIHFNSTGNPGMATGGSGDVLTGIITALLAQGYSAADAAILGVFQHGRAGDSAAEAKGQMAMIAGDIIDFLRW